MLPLETDLNTLPMIPNIPEKVFPNDAKNTEGDPAWRLIIIIWLKEREKKILACGQHPVRAVQYW